MCGIAGIVARNPNAMVDKQILTSMTRSIAHRGPDGEGLWTAPGIGLGHRRLAIIDIAGGAQPMHSACGRYSISFNGEIYNFHELARELDSAGVLMKGRSDTEVLIEAYARWGKKCVSRLRGMFAFAIWDAGERSLFLARDRIGEKPLYFSELKNGEFAFGSELKTILAHPAHSDALALDAVEDFLALGYIPDPKTMYQHIRKLSPGCFLTFRAGDLRPRITRYWSPPIAQARDIGIDPLETLPRLTEVVKRQMVADVPLGSFLSGGVDSSAITGLMSEISAEPVKSFAIGSTDAAYDEAPQAQFVAQHFATEHKSQAFAPTDISLLDMLADIYDEPFADVSALPTYRLAALARGRVTVALSGDGGDEIFGGYRRYRLHMREEALRHQISPQMRRRLFRPLASFYPKLDWAPQMLRAKSTFESLAADTASAYFNSVARGADRDRLPLMSAKFKDKLHGYHSAQQFKAWLASVGDADPLGQIQYLDFKSYLPGGILTKVDRASMAHGLEVRIPMLDHDFVTWGLQARPDQMIDGSEGKKLFKSSLRGFVPDCVLDAPKKGFTLPINTWMRAELRTQLDTLITDNAILDSGLFSRKTLSAMIRRQKYGQRDHSALLWSLMVLNKVLEKHSFSIA